MIEHFLNQTCEIQEFALVDNAHGIKQEQRTTKQVCECRVTESGTSILNQDNMQDGNSAKYKIYLPSDTNISIKDRIVIGEDNYKILGIYTPTDVV